MIRILIVLIIVSVVGVSCANPSSDVVVDELVSFSGEVRRGQSFEKEIGQNLTFRLNHYKGDGEGWVIWVGNKTQPDHDFSACVTLPLRGLNSRFIEGWHFRNGDNSGPRAPDDSIGLEKTRAFSFVLDETDYQIAHNAVGKLLWPYNYSEEEVDRAGEMYWQLDKVEGVLTITRIELGNLRVGERAWIDQMEFVVELVPAGYN